MCLHILTGRQTDTYIHKHEHTHHLLGTHKLEQMNKSPPEIVDNPGHRNTAGKSINILHPIELFLGVLLCFLHGKCGYSLTWSPFNIAAAYPG